MTRDEIAAMPWEEWVDLRRFADFRLGLNQGDGEEDIDLG